MTMQSMSLRPGASCPEQGGSTIRWRPMEPRRLPYSAPRRQLAPGTLRTNHEAWSRSGMAQALGSQRWPGTQVVLSSLCSSAVFWQAGSLRPPHGGEGSLAQARPGQSVGQCHLLQQRGCHGLLAAGLVPSVCGGPGHPWAHLCETPSLVKYPQLQRATASFPPRACGPSRAVVPP